MANNNEKTCLMTDCSGVNKNGPGRFRSKMNEDTFEVNTLLRQNCASNDSSENFGSG